ncbi:MAG TPA: hypothetical protein VFF39_03510 [Verrucomicrobiae bacterium]|jgi:hypothetical protein|nr:hypothetical protein [Verrucomicrobiae bacterium]
MRIRFLVFVLLSFSPWIVAQDNCPEGFRFVGTLSGTGTESNPFNQRQALKLPENATLDESFQQKNIRITNGKSGAHSNTQANDIPKGILVITHGREDEVYQPGWAVSEPELKAIEKDSHGKITRYEFSMKLFCSVSSHGQNPYYAECSVDADVCYKPLHE